MTEHRRELLVVAGEASGDLHGARLVSELRRLEPDLAVFGLGGDELRAAGSTRWRTAPRSRSSGSPRCCASSSGRARSSTCCCARWTAAARPRGPHRLPGLQPPSRRRAEEAWREGGLLRQPAGLGLAARADQDDRPGGRPHAGPLPLRGRVLPAPWCPGGPRRPSAGRRGAAAAERLGPGEVSGPFRLALLPGSRVSEIEALLPVMLAAVKRLAEDLPVEVRLIRAPSVPREMLEEEIELSGLPVRTSPRTASPRWPIRTWPSAPRARRPWRSASSALRWSCSIAWGAGPGCWPG